MLKPPHKVTRRIAAGAGIPPAIRKPSNPQSPGGLGLPLNSPENGPVEIVDFPIKMVILQFVVWQFNNQGAAHPRVNRQGTSPSPKIAATRPPFLLQWAALRGPVVWKCGDMCMKGTMWGPPLVSCCKKLHELVRCIVIYSIYHKYP